MQVRHLKAEPNPRGGQIDLSWTNPDFSGFQGIKILRREFTFPEIPNDFLHSGNAELIYDKTIRDADSPIRPGQLVQFSDERLRSETIYYYAAVAYDGATPTPHYFPAFVSAMTTAAYQTAAHLYQNLPALYHRHDTILPPEMPNLDPGDKDKGQLQRLVEMFGLQLDLLRSFASAGRSFSDVDRIDGALLPLLAQWIGWQTDFTTSLVKQRNEIKYAPHYYRTTGIAANLRATLNRLTNWEVEIKEFAHHVFRSNNPEQLTIWEMEYRAGTRPPKAKLVTLDVAYEGRPVAVQADDGRHWLFYHARQSVPVSVDSSIVRTPQSALNRVFKTGVPTQDHWHLWYKIYDQGEWLAARRVTFAGDLNKYPAALQKNDGNFWLFWSAYEENGGRRVPQIKLNLLSAGRPAHPARVQGTIAGPFTFVDGDRFEITVDNGIPRVVTFRSEHFHNLAQASVAEVVALLDQEIPGVAVTATEEGKIILTSLRTGAASAITLPSSSVATKLGLGAPVPGRNAEAATLVSGRTAPFGLNGYKLVIRVDQDTEKTVEFTTESSAAEVKTAINRIVPDIAQVQVDPDRSERIRLTSPATGEASFVAVIPDPLLLFSMELRFSTELGTGTITENVRQEFNKHDIILVPGATIFVQDAGNEWVITNAAQVFNIRKEKSLLRVYDPANAAPKLGFGTPLPPATPATDDTEPAVFEDYNRNIWLFWSSRRNGTWKIWYNHFDVATHTWGRAKALTTALLADREPAVAFGERIWVFWSRKESNGLWNIFYRTTTTLDFNSHPNTAAESGDSTWSDVTPLSPLPVDYDNKEPAPILLGADYVELYYSSNRTDGWNIWFTPFTPAQGSDEQITSGQFTQRAPAVLKTDLETTRLWLRSNESQVYTSPLYPLAKTVDSRYSGSTTVDTRNPAKISLRRHFDDMQHYTFDTLKGDLNWHARDTIGVYLTSDITDPELIRQKLNLIKNGLKRFLPIQVRSVFIVQPRVNFRFLRTWLAGSSPGELNNASFRLFLHGVLEAE